MMPFRIAIAGILIFLFQGCAKIGTPSGGPKDVYPPEYISGTPENRSVNFSGDQVDIDFNEYIQLKEQNKEVIVSPPMKEKPLIRVRDKSIRVTFNEALLPQTTYTINFGKSLTDLNEGNILPDFEFVFSTGKDIDSLSVIGKISDAFTLKPEKEAPMLIMLYKNLADSAALLQIPKYYSKANKDGLFAINNIESDTFRVVAVKDGNNNLRYDPGLENVAFLDSLLVINAGNVHQETYIKDTVKIITPAVDKSVRKNKQDTTAVDTIIAPGRVIHTLSISLRSFIEESNKVFITTRERDAPNTFKFAFSRPLFDSLQITPLNFKADRNWILPEPSVLQDTISYWVTDTLIAALDTFKLKLNYTTTDSAGNYFTKTDTVRLRKPVAGKGGERGSRRRTREEETTAGNAKSLKLTQIKSRGSQDLNAPVWVSASNPIQVLNTDSVVFQKMVDTVLVKSPFKMEKDTGSLRKFSLINSWEESTKYKILFKPGTVRDIYGFTNDSTEISLTTQSEDYYGTVLLNFSSNKYPVIVQLLNEKSVVRSAIVEKSGIVTFNFIAPGRYSFKAIDDVNKNGKWDTGNFLRHIQPEKVYISGTPQQLRSNWDLETSWSISDEQGK